MLEFSTSKIEIEKMETIKYRYFSDRYSKPEIEYENVSFTFKAEEIRQARFSIVDQTMEHRRTFYLSMFESKDKETPPYFFIGPNTKPKIAGSLVLIMGGTNNPFRILVRVAKCKHVNFDYAYIHIYIYIYIHTSFS